MKFGPTTILPGNLILLIMATTLALDVYRTFFRDHPAAKAAQGAKS